MRLTVHRDGVAYRVRVVPPPGPKRAAAAERALERARARLPWTPPVVVEWFADPERSGVRGFYSPLHKGRLHVYHAIEPAAIERVIAHELGHLYAREVSGVPHTEADCDRFAAGDPAGLAALLGHTSTIRIIV